MTTVSVDGKKVSALDAATPLPTDYMSISRTGVSKKATIPSLSDLPSAGCIIGDSVMAAYLGQASVTSFMLTSADTAHGSTITSLAVAGNTIAQQQAAWTADTSKATYDWILVCVGLNDAVEYAESSATAMARYQTLIDTINAGKKATSKIIVATMTPARARFIALLGGTNGATAYTKWLAMNTAIMATVTGVDYRIDSHTAAMNDGSGNLRFADDYGDGIHPVDYARKNHLARHFKAKLNSLGFLQKGAAVADFSPKPENTIIEVFEQPTIANYRNIVTTVLLKGAAPGMTCESSTGVSGFYDYNDQTVFYSHSGTGDVTSADFVFIIDQAAKNIRLGIASRPTNATSGFPYIPSCAGTPTGAPTAITGFCPLVIDSTNNRLYFYSNGAWRNAGP